MSNSELRRLARDWLSRMLREAEGPKNGRWTQTALAAKAGITRQVLWSILRMRADPALATVQALAGALGVPVPPIYEMSSRMPTSPPGRLQEPQSHGGLTPRPQTGRVSEPPITDAYARLPASELWRLLAAAIRDGQDWDLVQRLSEAFGRAQQREHGNGHKEGR